MAYSPHLILIISVSVAACATQTQLMVDNAQSALRSAQAQNASCTQAALNDPAVAVLKARLGNGPPSLERLRDKTRASKAEIDAMIVYDARQRPCREIVLKAFQDNAPLYVPIFLNTYAERDRVAVAVMDQKITWGQAAQDWQDTTTKFTTEMGKMDVFYGQQIAQAQAAEVAQRQQIAAALSQWGEQQQENYRQQQMINAMRSPTNTRCTYVGNTMDCTHH